MSADLLTAISDGDLNISLPQTLTLKDRRILRCERLLRLLPGKRAVFVATCEHDTMLAKLFLPSAQRQVERERNGFAQLRKAQQPTPDLLATIPLAGATALLYEFLPNAVPLFDEKITPDMNILQRLLDRLQSMYAAGIYQRDLHWGNFLLDADTVVVIDTDAIAGEASTPLDSNLITDNLGLLIAQFRRGDQLMVRDAIMSHSVVSAFSLNKQKIVAASERNWQQRKRELLAKCFRNTTAIAFTQRFDRVFAYRRECSSADLLKFFEDPDSLMAAGSPLKLGNSATVVKVMFDGKPVVIKRYNIKNVMHWLRRCLRPSRAWASWRNARRLELLGLDTPAPIAFMEMRCGPLRRRAYYVCEYMDGEELLRTLQQRVPTAEELASIEDYFRIAASDHLIHGDMKATNFFLSNDRLAILDLDAMREVENHSRWQKLFRRDFERFTRNWPGNAHWLNRLRQLLAEVIA